MLLLAPQMQNSDAKALHRKTLTRAVKNLGLHMAERR